MLLPLGILASSGGAAAADYELISTTVLSSNTASVTFSGLDTSAAAYKHLQIRFAARQTTTGGNLRLRFNSDTGSNYAYHQLYAFGGNSIGSNGNTAQTALQIAGTANSSYGSNVFSAGIIDILDFTSTSKNTTARGLSGVPDPATNFIYLRSGVWLNTAAVTSISVFGDGSDLATGTRVSLYGLKG